jgi:hypothetical protein
MGNPDLREIIQVGWEIQSVARQAEEHLRKFLPDEPYGFNGLFGIGERVSRACNPRYRDPGFLFEDLLRVAKRLIRRKHGAGDPRTALVHTVVFPVAVVASYVAMRSHRQVKPPALTFHFRVEAGMSIEIQVDFHVRILS